MDSVTNSQKRVNIQPQNLNSLNSLSLGNTEEENWKRSRSSKVNESYLQETICIKLLHLVKWVLT